MELALVSPLRESGETTGKAVNDQIRAPGENGERTRGDGVRLALIAAGWLALLMGLAKYGARLVPLNVARLLTLEQYLTLVQLTTLGVGLAASFLLLSRPREQLGLAWTSSRSVLIVALLSPAVFVLASYLAVALALPTLLEELRRGGAELARSQTGEFGRAMTTAPVWSSLLWAAVVSPVGEEFLFRGALWSGLQRLVQRFTKPASQEALSERFLSESRLVLVGRRCTAWWRRGGGATVLSSLVFALMHADLRGGQGIIRIVAASCLALACGSARQATGSLAAPIALHVIFNFLTLASARRWVVFEAFPKFFMVPTLVSMLAGLGALLAVVVAMLGRRRAK
jgi:membrane protease YdiL (CAAX protease family)